VIDGVYAGLEVWAAELGVVGAGVLFDEVSEEVDSSEVV
jgi:hypothetical protein